VELPGHGARFAEPLLTSMEALVDGVLPDLLRLPVARFVLFGHSMGGCSRTRWLAGYRRLASHRSALWSRALRHPTCRGRIPPLRQLAPEDFLPAALRLGLAAPAMAEHAELAELHRVLLILVEAYVH
jgi:surfactin synthase thioesterase subunit